VTSIGRCCANIFHSPFSQRAFDNLCGPKNARIPAGSVEQHRSAVLQIVLGGRIQWLIEARPRVPLKDDECFCGVVYWMGSHGQIPRRSERPEDE